MDKPKIQFIADRVKVKTGRVDNSADVTFEVGEYQLKEIKDLMDMLDKNLKVTVEVADE